MIVDLETVNPHGRIDVLAYRGAEHLTRKAEEHFGLQGLWDAIKPHANKLVSEYVGDVEIHPAVQTVLAILQANYKGGV